MKMSTRIIRTYTELIRLKTFEERYEYLRLSALIGEKTFGFERYLNQVFYRSPEWKRTRREVIRRDNGCDLGIDGRDIFDQVIVHHINPMTPEDIELDRDWIYDPEYLICVSDATHKAIHYGDKSKLITLPKERSMNDTCPWKL
jgi:hypothetical protein